MKLASLRNGRPDGQLVLVSRDLTSYVSAGKVAPTLQAALDAWDTAAPALAGLQKALDGRAIAAQPFDPQRALAPLPRAFQWIDGAGYLGQLERVRSVKGGKEVDAAAQKPLLYQGASDSLSGPTAPIVVPGGDLGIDYEAEVCAVTGAVPMKPSREDALASIRLIGICNDVSLRRLVSDDLQQGFGFFHAKPSTAFSPVFATPDELGPFWANGRLLLKVQSSVNGKLYGQPNAGIDVKFDFADLIMAAAQTRQLGAGTIVGSGTVANRHDEALPLKRDGIGFSCIAEARTMEKLKYGRARTPFLQDGDRVRIAAVDDEERPVFGIIDQVVTVTAGG
jgi:fumarylacetoacetate (FAA) hydrolase